MIFLAKQMMRCSPLMFCTVPDSDGCCEDVLVLIRIHLLTQCQYEKSKLDQVTDQVTTQITAFTVHSFTELSFLKYCMQCILRVNEWNTVGVFACSKLTYTFEAWKVSVDEQETLLPLTSHCCTDNKGQLRLCVLRFCVNGLFVCWCMTHSSSSNSSSSLYKEFFRSFSWWGTCRDISYWRRHLSFTLCRRWRAMQKEETFSLALHTLTLSGVFMRWSPRQKKSGSS